MPPLLWNMVHLDSDHMTTFHRSRIQFLWSPANFCFSQSTSLISGFLTETQLFNPDLKLSLCLMFFLLLQISHKIKLSVLKRILFAGSNVDVLLLNLTGGICSTCPTLSLELQQKAWVVSSIFSLCLMSQIKILTYPVYKVWNVYFLWNHTVAAIFTGLSIIDNTTNSWLMCVMGGFVAWEAIFYTLLELFSRWKKNKPGKDVVMWMNLFKWVLY